MRSRPLFRPGGIALICASLFLAQSIFYSVPGARASEPEVFGTQETFSADLKPFTKWNDAVRRTAAQAVEQQRTCREDVADPACVLPRWEALVAELRTLPLRDRIDRANELLNRRPYVLATTNWHDPDHWETPFEFLAKGGQCEDYAFAKFMALAASGVSENDLRFVVVHDKVSEFDHAVTIVFVDNEALVLDNQIKDVRPASQINRYVPYYSINLSGWWSHAQSQIKIAGRAAG